ncbi:MAG: hypothetical protein WBA44_02290 [Mesorhizobium sp.]
MSFAKDKIAAIVRKKIAEAQAESDFRSREAIYSHFRQRVVQGVEEGRFTAESLGFLSEIVEEIESEMSHVNPEDIAMEPAQEPKEPGRSSSGLKLILAAIVALGVAVAGYYFYNTSNTTTAASGKVDLASFVINPNEDAAAASANPAKFTIATQDGASVVRAKGPLQLFSSEMIKVDTARSYEVKVRLRLLPAPDGSQRSTRVYVGLATYDANGVLQTSQPGAHRYGVMANEQVSSNDGWIERTAVFSGAGDERHDQFRPGTASVRLLVLANYRSDADNEVEISELGWRVLPQ